MGLLPRPLGGGLLAEKRVSRKTFATFNSLLPDDTVWDDEGSVVTPGGKRILEWLSARLRALDWKCEGPKPHQFYGWVVEVATAAGTVLLIIQFPDPWLLIVTRERSFWQRVRGISDDDVDVLLLKAVEELLSTHRETVSDVKWFAREEYSRR